MRIGTRVGILAAVLAAGIEGGGKLVVRKHKTSKAKRQLNKLNKAKRRHGRRTRR